MTGLVLCGGQSSRMGSDKGLLKLEAKTWAETAIDKIETLHIPAKISVNQQQYIEYAKIFHTDQLIQDDTGLNIKGPLLGVLSCHIQQPTQDIFVLACDMPLMNPVVLKELNNHYLLHPEAHVYIYTNDQEPEPLCAIYTSKALMHILNLYRTGKLPKHSMKFVLDQVIVSRMPLREDQKPYFTNFNAHSQLNGL